MKAAIKTITPAMARKMLAGSTMTNRSVKPRVVERYARDMRAGNWLLNGESIVMNGEAVYNGHHRLLACIEADVPFETVVVSDADEGVMQTLDQGVGRSLADVMRLTRGTLNETKVASVVRLGWRWDNGVVQMNRNPSISENLAWFDAHPGTTSATKFVDRVAGAPVRMSRSVAAVVFLRANEAGEGAAATEFFDRLYDGEHLAHGDAVYALRKVLQMNATRVYGRLRQAPILALTIKAWNFYMAQEQIQILKWGRASTGRERFPVMLDSSGTPISQPTAGDDG